MITAVVCFFLAVLWFGVVIADGVHQGEYPWPPRRARRVRAALPRRPARLSEADNHTLIWVRALRAQPTWTAAMLRARLTVLNHVISQAQIPPTETPDPQPQLDYDETRTDWAEIREELFAMLAADGGE